MRFWERPKKEFVEFLLFDDKGEEIARMRVKLFIKKSKLENYVVQFEYKVGEFLKEWATVVRHNCYHGFSHKDVFSASGKGKKIELGKFKDLNEAVKFAIKDIKENAKEYIKEFEEG